MNKFSLKKERSNGQFVANESSTRRISQFFRVIALTVALLVVSINGALALTYTITKSGSNYAVHIGVIALSEPGPLQVKIDQIRGHANGDACTIQFGDGSVLSVNATVFFDDYGGGTWGDVTLKGSLSGIPDYGSFITNRGMTINSAVTINSTDNSNPPQVFINEKGGTLTISGGTISSKTKCISNAENGTVNISGGTITSSGDAIVNKDGTLNITGGTVKTTTTAAYSAIYFPGPGGEIAISGGTVDGGSSYAIYSQSIGKISVRGSSVTNSGNVKSANTKSDQGTICVTTTSASSDEVISVSGWGKVSNTAAGGNAILNNSKRTVSVGSVTQSVSATTGIAIKNNNTGTVKVTAGVVSTTTGMAIQNNSTGTIDINGGTVRATAAGGRAVRNESTGAVNISGGKVLSDSWVAVVNASTGKITISGGEVTSGNKDAAFGTVYLFDNGTATADRLVISGGTVENTASGGNAIYNNSKGGVKISSSSASNKSIVRATTGVALLNNNTGTVNLTSLFTFVSATGGIAVRNNSSGLVDIKSGASISSTSYAIFNNAGGKVNIGTLVIVSSSGANPTINNASNGEITVSAGIVQTSGNGVAIRNAATGKVTISGGKVLATTGVAVYNVSSGAVTITGGIGFAYGTAVTDVISGTMTVPPTSNAVLVAWNKNAGNTSYVANASNDILKIPEAATAVWGTVGSSNGIKVDYNTTSGFISVAGITIDGVVSTYPVTVIDGSGEGEYEEGATVTITANEAPEGFRFKEWMITPEVTFAGGTSETDKIAKFIMPAEAVTAIAMYEEEVGINETSMASLRVYPNPTTGQLTIENGQWAMDNVEIYDIMGRSVGAYRIRPNENGTTTINVEFLPPGVYFLKIGNKTAKFVKQ